MDLDLNSFESVETSEIFISQTQTYVESDAQKKTRKGNYVIEEDVALVRAWLNISEDAVIGRDQKSTRLWEHILETFHQFLGKITRRNYQGLQNRWQLISHDVSKFCGHYNQVGRLNPSGWSDQMKFDRAKEDFGEIEGANQQTPVSFYRFKFEHCWKLLKDSSKWNEYSLVRNTNKGSKKQSKVVSNSSNANMFDTQLPSTVASTITDSVSLVTDTNLGRPVGRKKSKRKKREEDDEDESASYLKIITQTLKDAASIEKEKWEAKKKIPYEKALIQEMKVMSQSMDGLTPEQVAYWKLQQSIILERYKKDGRLSTSDSHPFDSSIDLNEF